jgi:hypothetical protein
MNSGQLERTAQASNRRMRCDPIAGDDEENRDAIIAIASQTFEEICGERGQGAVGEMVGDVKMAD